jgi:SAM-dependent methyltransferase
VTTSRYDAIADWYVAFTRDWPREPVAPLPPNIAGQRVLDLACGYGTTSRYLARAGAAVTAVDLSRLLLARAAEIESRAAESSTIRYVHGDATDTDWWDGEQFDGVVCNMALMDIDDLSGALATVFAVLEAGGWFSLSILHPCFPGGPSDGGSGLSSWPPDRGYAWEGLWNTDGIGVRGHASVNHRRLSTYVNALLAAGFDLEEVTEPPSDVPRFLAVRCRRRSRS